jgi:hypothetical protein
VSLRPRPKARLILDVDNPYARLGVSPLAGIDEIKRVASEQRGKWMAQRRAEGQQGSADIEAEIIAIQDVERQIGTPAARAIYDREHPQNVLLTVQPAPRDRAFSAAGTSALVTAWLFEELGADAMLVHPDAHWLWLPAGNDAELLAELARYQGHGPDGPRPAATDDTSDSLSPESLGRLRPREPSLDT